MRTYKMLWLVPFGIAQETRVSSWPLTPCGTDPSWGPQLPYEPDDP